MGRPATSSRARSHSRQTDVEANSIPIRAKVSGGKLSRKASPMNTRELINGLIDGRLEISRAADVTIGPRLTLAITRQKDCLRIDWDPPPEIDLPGPFDPDLCYAEIGRTGWKVVTPVGTVSGKF